MSTLIKCPSCTFEFAPEDAIAKTLEKEFQEKINAERQKLRQQVSEQEAELENQRREFEKKKENENNLFLEKINKERIRIEAEAQEKIRKQLHADFENQIRTLKEEKLENEERLKAARDRELEFMRKENELRNKEAELEIQLQKKLAEERQNISDQIRRQEIEKNAIRENEQLLRMKELEKQLDDQKKLAEEMKRKAEQGSMQLQGEVQETVLESMLRQAFPFDLVMEVGKGVKGADCIQVVRNNFGQECGKIIYESKRTENFGGDWIEKFKKDMRSTGSDIAVLVTKTMPRDMECFGLREGIWVCNFSEVRALANVLRESIIRIYASAKSQENKGDKMHLLYDYLTSNEFSEQWKAIREGFLSMKISIQKERDAMEKLWKAREKQLEKVLLNAAHFKGSIEGIAGQDMIDLSLSDDEGRFLEEN